jgi:uncharacterized membrane protein HdeD (DUF308 family)
VAESPWRIVTVVAGGVAILAGVGIVLFVPVSTPLLATVVLGAGALTSGERGSYLARLQKV